MKRVITCKKGGKSYEQNCKKNTGNIINLWGSCPICFTEVENSNCSFNYFLYSVTRRLFSKVSINFNNIKFIELMFMIILNI